MQSSEEGETKFCRLLSAPCFLYRGLTSTCKPSLSLCCPSIVVMLFGGAGERKAGERLGGLHPRTVVSRTLRDQLGSSCGRQRVCVSSVVRVVQAVTNLRSSVVWEEEGISCFAEVQSRRLLVSETYQLAVEGHYVGKTDSRDLCLLSACS